MDGVEVNGYTIEPGADLRGADLREVPHRGADLERTDLSRANLREAKADENTTWPEEFDPVAAGVTFEDKAMADEGSDRESEQVDDSAVKDFGKGVAELAGEVAAAPLLVAGVFAICAFSALGFLALIGFLVLVGKACGYV